MKSRTNQSFPLHARFHRAIREFPRYNRFLEKAGNLALSLPESHCLVEIGAHRSLEMSRLIDLLGLEKSVISKIVAALARSRHVVTTPDSNDRRARILTLSASGQALLARFDAASNDRLKQFDSATGMTKGEIRHLADVLNKLSDALKAPETAHRLNEHILRAGIRRLTRAFGLLGRRALGSELNTIEWQALLSLAENPSCYTPSELARYLSVHKSAMAIALGELDSRGLITRVNDSHDKRITHLAASTAGYRLISKIEDSTAERFSAWRDLREEEVALLERWIRGAATTYHLDDKGLSTSELTQAEEIRTARHITASFYISHPNKLTRPAELFSERNRLVGLFQDQELVAAVELSRNKTPEVISLYSHQNLPVEGLRAFIARAVDPLLNTEVVASGGQFENLLRCHISVITALGRLFI